MVPWAQSITSSSMGSTPADITYISTTYKHLSTSIFCLFQMHVRGHHGNEGNEAADRLANEGAKKPPAWSWAGTSNFSSLILFQQECLKSEWVVYGCDFWCKRKLGACAFLCLYSQDSLSSAGIACWLERRTHDRKVASLNPGRSGRRIFFSRVNFVCWLLFGLVPPPCYCSGM